MNQFESLCKLASDENWCWKPYCTTCGTTSFRYAFREIARGKYPDNPEWPVHGGDSITLKQYGMFTASYSDVQKATILGCCLQANIRKIAGSCRFPDWLGYMSLVLEYMRMDSNLYRSLSSSWAMQLKEMVYDHSPIYFRLSEIAENSDALLNINDLEEVENNYESQNELEGDRLSDD